MTRVILETDSLILKQALESDSYIFAEVGGMLYEMKNVISSHFSNFFCSFAPRTCNKVAHASLISRIQISKKLSLCSFNTCIETPKLQHFHLRC
jgi:hypothetical protein